MAKMGQTGEGAKRPVSYFHNASTSAGGISIQPENETLDAAGLRVPPDFHSGSKFARGDSVPQQVGQKKGGRTVP